MARIVKPTDVFKQNFRALKAGYKIIVNQGGTSSSKTFSIVQLLTMLLESTNMGLVSCVAESMPHLKRGIIRDFKNILGDDYDDNRFNKTDFIYNFSDDNNLEFFSIDNASKLRGGRRRYLFMNEANNNPLEAFEELDVRTERTTFVDFNPTAAFWVHDLLKHHGITDFSKTYFPPDHREICFIHSTYMGARHVLPKQTVEKIESRRLRDPNWWNVYGLGLIGKIEGLVYPNWDIVDAVPPLHKPVEIFGLDFGFATDPTALVKCTIKGENLYSEELIYETGMTNAAISSRMNDLGVRKNYDIIAADSAEPKSIQELCDAGWNVIPVKKGADSVEHGHQKVNQFRQHITRASVNLIKEVRNFMYIKDKNGMITDKTTHFFSHATDARRYAVVSVETNKYDLDALSDF